MKHYRITFLLLVLISCTKQNKNNRLFAGNWELEKITTTSYQDNEVSEESDTTFYGVMQLQNGPDVVDGNEAYFSGFVPFQTDYCNWNISTGKPKTITFYLWNVDAGINYSYVYNVEKISKRKLTLVSYTPDGDLNLQMKTTLEFKKVH